jgi:hypothetical protein
MSGRNTSSIYLRKCQYFWPVSSHNTHAVATNKNLNFVIKLIGSWLSVDCPNDSELRNIG